MRKRSGPRLWLAGLASMLVFGAALAAALPALADYLGPNRTVTTWEWRRLRCHYQAVYDPPGPPSPGQPPWYGCTLELYYTPDSSCPSTSSVVGYFTTQACGWTQPYCQQIPGCDIDLSDSVVSCSSGEEGCRAVEQTVTYPEATVSGSVACAVAGSGGWCRGGAELSLSGSEPLSGYTILALEGTRNGETFACQGPACSVPFVEGGNDFSFWAMSSWGDTSRMGMANGRLDSGPPWISGDVAGTAGEAGWYVSEVTVTASAGDAVSGVAAFDLALDDGGWVPYPGPITLGDGEHTVALQAADAAGNAASESLEVRVDTAPPDLDLTAGGSFCPGCGETLDLTFNVQDGGSGVAAWSLSADDMLIASGSAPASQTLAWDGSGVGVGTCTLSLSAGDIAGNAAEVNVTVELVAPTAVPPPEEPPSERPPGPVPLGPVTASAPTATLAAAPTATRVAPPTRTPRVSSFGGIPAVPPEVEAGSIGEGESGPKAVPPASTEGSSSGVLWGAAAAVVIASATAVGLDQARRRREEEARLRAEMERQNAEAEAREAEARRRTTLARLAALAAAAAAAGEMTREAEDHRAEQIEELLEAQGHTARGPVEDEAPQSAWDRWVERKEELLEAQDQAARERAEREAAQQVELQEEARRLAAATAQAERLRQIAEGRDEAAPALSTGSDTLREGDVGEDQGGMREPDTYLTAADEWTAWSDPVILRGGPGTSPTYAEVAEEGYRGHSGGGPPDPRVAVPGLFNRFLAWVRDTTPLMDWMVHWGWIRPDASAGATYRVTDVPPSVVPDLSHLELPGFRWDAFGSTPPASGTVLDPGGRGLTITAVQVSNSGNQVLHIRDVWIDLYAAQGSTPYSSQLAYPFDYPILTVPDFNRIQPGDLFRLNLDSFQVPPGSRALVHVRLQSSTGGFGIASVEIAP